MPASHSGAASLQPGDGLHLTLQGLEDRGDVVGSSAGDSGSRVDLGSSTGLDTASEALGRRPLSVVDQSSSQVGCIFMHLKSFQL